MPMPVPPSDLAFEQAKQRFFDGLACFEAGQWAEAERLYLESLALLPGRVSTLINLAAAQVQLGKAQEALATADQVLAVEVDSADALLHRATALLQLERFDDALSTLDRLLKLNPDCAEALMRRAHALERLGRLAEALASFERVLALEPDHASAWSGSGGLLRELKRLDEAAHAYREALRHGADPELHHYYLASVGQHAAPPAAPQGYVQALFDSYADDFDKHLVTTLGYCAPNELVDGLRRLDAGPYESALDLGCGTGLCGPLVRPMVRHLAGIDLSPLMLQKAAALGVYDRLDAVDIVAHLNQTEHRHDLVLAADVFIYIGDLAPVFAGVRRVMARGVFCFSVEVSEPDLPSAQAAGEQGFQLLPSLRYAHAEPRLRQLAAQHGFAVLDIRPAPIRQDQRETVDGLFVYLRVAGSAP